MANQYINLNVYTHSSGTFVEKVNRYRNNCCPCETSSNWDISLEILLLSVLYKIKENGTR